MTDLSESIDISVGPEAPVDLQTDTGDLLLFLSGEAPIALTELAEQCQGTPSPNRLKSLLSRRFDNAVRIDQTKFVHVTDAAYSQLTRASKPYVKEAMEALKEGKTSREDGDYETALPAMRRAYALAAALQERFAATNTTHSTVEKLQRTAATYHDAAHKEATKDSVNYLVLQAQQAESKGDDALNKHPADAIAAYEEAEDHFSKAITRTTDYNDSRLTDDSSMLSIDPLKTRLEQLTEKLKTAKSNAGSSTETDDDQGHLRELRRVAEELDKRPTMSEFEANSDCVAANLADRFGSWEAALAAVDIDETSKTELIDEVQRLDEEVPGVPMSTDMRSDGKFGSHQYTERFGSWDEALEAAGIDKRSRIIDELQQLASKLGRSPKTSDMREHSWCSHGYIADEFGSWQAALDAAGVDETSRTELIDELQRLDEEVPGAPMSTDMRSDGKFSAYRYTKKFGSWDEALEAADIDKRSRIIDELQRLANELGRTPKRADMREHSWCSNSYISMEMGSWSTALEAAGLATTESPEKEDVGSSSNSELDASISNTPAKDIPDDAFEMTKASITQDGRLSAPIIVKVTNVTYTQDEKKSALLQIQDIEGEFMRLNVWRTHDINYDWEEGTWYALESARGKTWKSGASNRSQIKRLSSTRDFEITNLGTSFDPDSVTGNQNKHTQQSSSKVASQTSGTAGSSETPAEPTKTTATGTTDTSTTTSEADDSARTEGSDDDDDDALSDIMSEFDDL